MFRESNPSPASKIVFVVGMFRSGTSLLYAMLNQHPQLALMFECNVLDFPAVLSKKRFAHNWLERQEFYNQALSRHRLIFANRLRGLENVRTPDELYRTYGELKGAQLVGEKAPAYCPVLRQLARHYPQASFILIWRDPLETYRSIWRASRKVPFFRRIGLSRFIFHQEQMVRQTAELEFAGLKTHHVRYNELVDRPEEASQSICRFLNIEFDPAMLNLANADLSATHPDSQRDLHEQLMSGVIERRKLSDENLDPDIVQKLQRFHARWRRLGGERLPDAVSDVEPFFAERLYHNAAGRILFFNDCAKRILLEFLPLVWLKTYRQTKSWFWNKRAANSGSLIEEFSGNRFTILMGFLILAAVAVFDAVTPPQLVMIPFYLLPPAILALTVSRNWGSLFAMVTALVWSAMKMMESPDWNSHYGMLLWNCAMRFLVLEFVVLLLSRIRLEITSSDCD